MRSIDECDKIPKDDSPARAVVGKHNNTLMTQSFNVTPSETLENLKLKVELAHTAKWPSHLSGKPTSVRMWLWCAWAELKASYRSHQRNVIMPNSYACHLDPTESHPLVTFFKRSLLLLPRLDTIKKKNTLFSASAFVIPQTCPCYLDGSKQARFSEFAARIQSCLTKWSRL